MPRGPKGENRRGMKELAPHSSIIPNENFIPMLQFSHYILAMMPLGESH